MSRVANSTSLLWAYIVFNLKGNWAFRTSFVLQVFSMIVNNTIWVAFWLIYFAKFPIVHGWHQSDILMLWGVTATAFGIMTVLFGNITNVGTIVANGELDIYLSNPKPVLLHLLISRQGVSSWGDVIFGVVVLIFSVPTHASSILELLAAVVAACLILIGFSIVSQSLVFYTRGREGLGAQLIGSFITVATYPPGIFHGVLIRIIIFAVIPAGFISTLPFAIIEQTRPETLAYSVLVGVFEVVLGRFLFYQGLKIYTSGNRMTVRS